MATWAFWWEPVMDVQIDTGGAKFLKTKRSTYIFSRHVVRGWKVSRKLGVEIDCQILEPPKQQVLVSLSANTATFVNFFFETGWPIHKFYFKLCNLCGRKNFLQSNRISRILSSLSSHPSFQFFYSYHLRLTINLTPQLLQIQSSPFSISASRLRAAHINLGVKIRDVQRDSTTFSSEATWKSPQREAVLKEI